MRNQPDRGPGPCPWRMCVTYELRTARRPQYFQGLMLCRRYVRNESTFLRPPSTPAAQNPTHATYNIYSLRTQRPSLHAASVDNRLGSAKPVGVAKITSREC